MDKDTLPKDEYSNRLRDLRANPAAIEKTSTIERSDFLGNAETWLVKTIRVDGNETIFLSRLDAGGGSRMVIPPEVADAIARQRSSAVDVVRRRAAHKGAATRRASK